MDDHLEKFRLQWKKELKGRIHTQKHEFHNKIGSTSSFMFSVGTDSKCHECSSSNEVPLTDRDRSLKSDARAEKLSYFPLQTVENLLDSKDEGADVSQSHTSINVPTCNSCDSDIKFNKNKRFKLTRLKDIFVDRQYGEIPSERLLDKLIADIDEITEIPFFDISLPREVAVKIFQHLGIKDLCSCAQVSRSWCSLAEDELLWCRLCHRLGHEKIYTTREKHNWKQIVRHNVERQRTLIFNWKNRVGKLSPLEHVKGKILCAVDVCGDNVVAGFTNGDVKLWNLSSDDSCVFQPSSTSLVLDVNEDGLQPNIVTSVVTSQDITVAAYRQGNVDIWSLKYGTMPLQTFTPTTGNQYIPKICISEDGTTLAVSYDTFIDTLHRGRNEDEFSVIQHFDTQNKVKEMILYDTGCDISAVIFSKDVSVHLYQPRNQGTSQTSHVTDDVTEIHNLIGCTVDVIDVKTDQSILGVATGSSWYDGLADGFKVKLYDLKTTKNLQTLHGHTKNITCMNLQESPAQELVTGCADWKLRVYDMRTNKPVQTLLGPLSPLTCVQIDGWKAVMGTENGFVCVWDRRTTTKLWELHNRHPVRYSRFNDKTLVVANISSNKVPELDDFEDTTHRRYRGTLNVYNFLEDLTTKDVPEICLSTYDQPDASKYNIDLAVPYDTLNF